ncbi:MAG: hypothetical protein CMJ49_04780 [Planctomycetaceae bacterium]|nr:hypothetical protein [Planctomycetaceae bacterium]
MNKIGTDTTGGTASDAPDLSIVVAIIAGGREPMATCLGALQADVETMKVEVLVPYDARLDDVAGLSDQFPWAQFIDARDRVDSESFGRHTREHHDVLRAIGLLAARGRVVALLEDHGTPSAQWCRSMLAMHEQDVTAVGGAVDNGVDRLLNWAVYYCDFGRYQNPVPEGEAEFLSDSNSSYKREALFELVDTWQDAFHETSINWELARRDGKLKLNGEMVVFQTRKTLTLGAALGERFVWGRSFAGTRAGEISGGKRVVYALLSWLLPFLMTLRIVRNGFAKRTRRGKLIAALPLIFVLQCFWAVGELVGYVTGRTGGPDTSTDAAAAG